MRRRVGHDNVSDFQRTSIRRLLCDHKIHRLQLSGDPLMMGRFVPAEQHLPFLVVPPQDPLPTPQHPLADPQHPQPLLQHPHSDL